MGSTTSSNLEVITIMWYPVYKYQYSTARPTEVIIIGQARPAGSCPHADMPEIPVGGKFDRSRPLYGLGLAVYFVGFVDEPCTATVERYKAETLTTFRTQTSKLSHGDPECSKKENSIRSRWMQIWHVCAQKLHYGVVYPLIKEDILPIETQSA